MRNRLMISTAALVLASATFAFAQAKQQQPQQQQQEQPSVSGDTTGGVVDVAGRFTSTDGDGARYQRYRDLRSGANINLLYNKVTDNYIFSVTAENVGYRDQRYNVGYNSKKVKANFYFTQIPLNYGFADDNITRTPYNCVAGNCTIDASLRQQVENKTAIGIPQNVSQLGNPSKSIYDSAANPFDLKSLRSTVGFNFIYSATDNLNLTFDFNNFKRTGNMPWGASFAFNVAEEVPLVVDNSTTNITAGIEWASHQGMMRVAYDYSKFNQNIPFFDFDNPQRATNWNKTPGTGYDPSGYSNGNGPASGRMAMPPSNTLTTFNFLGMVKLPDHTTANASFQMGANSQNEALIPWTTNPVVANANTYASFPGLAALPRDTAQMRVNYANAALHLNSRPNKYLTLSARYRFNSRTDVTREFDATEYVRFDAVPEESGGPTEDLNISENKLDLDGAVVPFKYGQVRFGYTFDEWLHTVRATEGWKDNTFRVSFDSFTGQYATLRLLYEHTKRDSINLDVADLCDECTIPGGPGAQPALRYFDEASRNRNRVTLIAELNPLPIVGVNFTYFYGKDDYQGADAQTFFTEPPLYNNTDVTQQFGLLNNKNTGFTIGANVAPSALVNFGAEYGRETYNALQQSRNANPYGANANGYESWLDPNRNWNLTNDEHVNNFQLYANLVRALPKTDIRFGWDYSDSDQAFIHGGPRITALTNNSILTPGDAKPCAAGVTSCFVAFPNVTEKWNRLTVDLKHDINKQLGVGFSYWYEKYSVQDFSTIDAAGPQTLPRAELGTQTDQPRIDWLGSIFTGYMNRPYKGQTVFARVYYMF